MTAPVPPKKSLFLSPPTLQISQTKSSSDHKTVSKVESKEESKEKKLKDLKKQLKKLKREK